MRKFVSLLLVAALFCACLPTVFAAGSVSLKGPDTVRAGDTITVTFSAGGDNIYGGQCTVSYDAAQLTLKGYTTSSLGGSWKVENTGDKFVFYDDSVSSPLGGSKTIFKASFTVKNLEPGTEVSVSVTGVKLSDENFTDTSFGTKTYKATILPPLSGNCTLASMTVGNADISPAFSPDVTSYSASVPFTISKLEVEAAAEHPGATVTVKNTSLAAGETTTVKVIVKAENGAEKTYSIKVKRAQDPNYVPSNDASLQALTVEGAALSPAFSPEVTQYYVWLPYEVDSLSVTATAADAKAKAAVGNAQGLVAGVRNDIAITVTAEDGTVQVYTVTAVRAPAIEDTEAYLAGQLAAAPEPETQPTEEPTEPSQPAAEPTQPQQTQPVAMDNQSQIILLVGGCLAGLILGLLVGMLLFRKKSGYGAAAAEEEAEENKDPLSEDMPEF